MNPLTLEWVQKAEGDFTTAVREFRWSGGDCTQCDRRRPDWRHFRIPWGESGPGGAAFCRCLDGLPGTAPLAHHHVYRGTGGPPDHRGAGDRRRRWGLQSHPQRRDWGRRERVFSGRGGDWQSQVANTGSPCPAQYHGADHHHLQHQHRQRHHHRGVAELPGIRAAPRHCAPRRLWVSSTTLGWIKHVQRDHYDQNYVSTDARAPLYGDQCRSGSKGYIGRRRWRKWKRVMAAAVLPGVSTRMIEGQTSR